MPWFAISSLGIDGIPIKREILHRKDKDKVIDFLRGRFQSRRYDSEVFGWFISESTADETWDWDIDEPREPLPHAVEVPLVFGEKQPIE